MKKESRPNIGVTSQRPLVAGVRAALTISFSGARLGPGSRVAVAFDYRGVPRYEETPQTADANAPNHVSVRAPEGVAATAAVEIMSHYDPGFRQGGRALDCESYRWLDLIGPEFSLNSWNIAASVVSGEVPPDGQLEFLLGHSGPGFLLSNKSYSAYPFWARVDVKGDGAWQKAEGCAVTIRPGKAVHAVFYSPSTAVVGEIVAARRSNFDANFNLADCGEPVPVDCRRPGMSTPPTEGAGEARIELNPTLVREDEKSGGMRIWWGEIHAHTAMCDGGCRPLGEYYEWGRDAVCLDFSAMASHDFGIACRGYQEAWAEMQAMTNRFNKPGRFVTLLGWEASHLGMPANKATGHKNIYFREDDVPFFNASPYGGPRRARVDAEDYERWIEIVDRLAAEGKHPLVIPHHTQMVVYPGSMGTNWNCFEPRWERLVEIFSLWGCSEQVNAPWAAGATEGAGVLAALMRGYRLGFVAGSDGHGGRPASRGEHPRNVHESGLTAVYAPTLSREAIFDALWERRTYATTGPRIVLDAEIGGLAMGREASVEPGDPVERERSVKVIVGAPREIDRVEVIRNGQIAHTFQGGSEYLELDWSDETPLGCWSSTDGEGARFVFYYVRVWLKDLHRAWSSPVWFRLKR